MLFSIFVSRLSSDSHLLSVWFELGTEARQSSPLQCSGFQFSCFCPDRGLFLVLVLGLIPGPVGPSVGRGQMRVSWCQRLDGRMLSTFSMIKFRGANSVLRNYKERQIQSHKQNVNRAASIFSLKYTTLHSGSNVATGTDCIQFYQMEQNCIGDTQQCIEPPL